MLLLYFSVAFIFCLLYFGLNYFTFLFPSISLTLILSISIHFGLPLKFYMCSYQSLQLISFSALLLTDMWILESFNLAHLCLVLCVIIVWLVLTCI